MAPPRTIASGRRPPERDAANFSDVAVYVHQDGEDADLVRRCLAGDTEAFSTIVERYQRVLFTVALRFLGEREAAADAAQNAFVRAYERLDTFDPARRFFSWMYRIIINECLNAKRGARPSEPVPETLTAGADPFELFEAAERRRRVQGAILALPTEYREVIVLRHFAGLSYDETADALGVASSVVKSRLYTARQRLSQMLVGLNT
jgi:RNA polymerase sigma-70 factor (ECF subfamily)